MDDRPRQPSIWAPQPQPSESTWPKTLDSFSRVAEHDQAIRVMHQQQQQPVITREDVFGPVQPTCSSADMYAPTKHGIVGAIGDGRKRNSPTGDFDDTVSSFLSAYILAFLTSPSCSTSSSFFGR